MRIDRRPRHNLRTPADECCISHPNSVFFCTVSALFTCFFFFGRICNAHDNPPFAYRAPAGAVVRFCRSLFVGSTCLIEDTREKGARKGRVRRASPSWKIGKGLVRFHMHPGDMLRTHDMTSMTSWAARLQKSDTSAQGYTVRYIVQHATAESAQHSTTQHSTSITGVPRAINPSWTRNRTYLGKNSGPVQ